MSRKFRKGARVMVRDPRDRREEGFARVPGTVTRQGHSGMTYVLLDETPREIPYYNSSLEALPPNIDPRKARVDGDDEIATDETRSYGPHQGRVEGAK